MAVDSTGFEGRHTSRHYVVRSFREKYLMGRFPKLSLGVDTASHMIVSLKVSRGPTHDVCEAPEVLREAYRAVKFKEAVMDKGYDSEQIHRFVAEVIGAKAWIPPRAFYKNRRKWPKGMYRRSMRRSFDYDAYARRPQVESAISRHKRRLGSALRAIHWKSQKRDLFYRILTHNLMILRLDTTFRQSQMHTDKAAKGRGWERGRKSGNGVNGLNSRISHRCTPMHTDEAGMGLKSEEGKLHTAMSRISGGFLSKEVLDFDGSGR